MSADPQAARKARRLLRIHTGAAIATGIALGLAVGNQIGLAIAAIVVALIGLIASVETLRVLVFSNREPRR